MKLIKDAIRFIENTNPLFDVAVAFVLLIVIGVWVVIKSISE